MTEQFVSIQELDLLSQNLSTHSPSVCMTNTSPLGSPVKKQSNYFILRGASRGVSSQRRVADGESSTLLSFDTSPPRVIQTPSGRRLIYSPNKNASHSGIRDSEAFKEYLKKTVPGPAKRLLLKPKNLIFQGLNSSSTPFISQIGDGVFRKKNSSSQQSDLQAISVMSLGKGKQHQEGSTKEIDLPSKTESKLPSPNPDGPLSSQKTKFSPLLAKLEQVMMEIADEKGSVKISENGTTPHPRETVNAPSPKKDMNMLLGLTANDHKFKRRPPTQIQSGKKANWRQQLEKGLTTDSRIESVQGASGQVYTLPRYNKEVHIKLDTLSPVGDSGKQRLVGKMKLLANPKRALLTKTSGDDGSVDHSSDDEPGTPVRLHLQQAKSGLRKSQKAQNKLEKEAANPVFGKEFRSAANFYSANPPKLHFGTEYIPTESTKAVSPQAAKSPTVTRPFLVVRPLTLPVPSRAGSHTTLPVVTSSASPR